MHVQKSTYECVEISKSLRARNSPAKLCINMQHCKAGEKSITCLTRLKGNIRRAESLQMECKVTRLKLHMWLKQLEIIEILKGALKKELTLQRCAETII